MGSSGGGDSGAGSMAMMMQGSPMPGLPIAGKDTAIDPYKYGQFQNFLPEIQAEGQNPMATGLRPDMFKYTRPGGGAVDGAATGEGDDTAGQIQELRDELAKLTADGSGGGGGNPPYGYNPFDNMSPGYSGQGWGGGRGTPGTMGMGGGFMGGGSWGGGRPGSTSGFLPDGKTPVTMQGQYGGTDQYGRGNFSSGPMPEALLNIPIGR